MRTKTIIYFILFLFCFLNSYADSPGKKMTADSYFSRAALKYERGEYKDAIVDLDTAIKMSPKHYRALSMRGVIKNWLADMDGSTDCSRALADLDMATKLKPDYPPPYFYRGIIFYKLNDYEKALSEYNTYLRLDPDDAGTYYNRALVNQKMGRFKAAREDFKTAKELGFKGKDLFGEGGSSVLVIVIISAGIFLLLLAILIAIIAKRGSDW